MSEVLTIEELTQYAEKFLADKYGFKLAIPIKRNNRLTNTLGRYISCAETGQPLKIDLSGRLLEYGTEWAILDTLKHELIHYATHCLGENFDDGADFFENELRKHGVSPTRTITVGRFYITQCRACGKETTVTVKRQIERASDYVMGCCSSRYAYVGDVIYDGERREEIRFEQATA